ncbi:flagellar hook protein FlgE [Nitrosomonas cryotolerans]|uniref:Flagellar hook protein FlgE n=1 Tax=Nitrosomonas cryotolerans ATCC 49181 TaxID=1131553 RepID=A0A1N6ILA6_9PROT|nr:flagellar hook protein FlgE [Nitrosomonas cryotolerans]SFP37288.1 flagellar hook protein FlgE [Nitrosomonas cryotolerans]SIO32781.1 flagellar hook protein FlgE [Nitrosomonas cryotolerans ATCC 49181]
MGFQHGLSGISAAAANLDVIGNNIANTNTVGFKQSQAQFSEVFANSLSTSNRQAGMGTEVSTIAQQFTQGNISTTDNPLDIAINGKGFFRMSDAGNISYSRNGQFHVDSAGFIVNANNLNLTGFMADPAGKITAATPTNLKLTTANLAPQATSSFTSELNLDSRTPVSVPISAFDATDPTTYASTTSGSIFDSLGNSHIFSLFFQKNDTNSWNAYATVDGAMDGAMDEDSGLPISIKLGGAEGEPQKFTFDKDGVLTTPDKPVDVFVTLANDTVSPLKFKLDLTKATQFGEKFSVNSLVQDGSSSARLAGFSVSEDGMISGNYTNGAVRTLGQTVLANFSNPQGLASLGGNQWAETASSGQALVGPPQSGTLGSLQSAAVEDSNVNLTDELVNMITAQRVYQANAKSIETQDAVLQTLVNL